MGEAGELTVLEVLLFAMLGMFLMTIALIFFFVIYQRRLLNQQQQHQKVKADYQTELLRASIDGQEEERRRVAKDLHDDIGAMLNTIKLYNDQIDVAADGSELIKLKNKANSMIDDTIESVRRISYDLHPVILESLGLIEALESLIENINDTDGVVMKFNYNQIPPLDFQVELALFRIIQELVTNTLKHACATEIQLQMWEEQDKIHVKYGDNGKGYMPDKLKNAKGLGLKNIESRVSLNGGRISYDKEGNETVANISLSINGNIK